MTGPIQQFSFDYYVINNQTSPSTKYIQKQNLQDLSNSEWSSVQKSMHKCTQSISGDMRISKKFHRSHKNEVYFLMLRL